MTSGASDVDKGLFITFEGTEGTGKSTQCRLLAEYLTGKGCDCVLTREPGGSDGAEQIRDLVLKGAVTRWDAVTEMLLMYAARRDHMVHKIIPALTAGKVVICDRFADSTTAYQGYGYGDKGVPLQDIRRLYDIVVGAYRPDITFVMDLPVETGLKRSLARDANSNRYERMDLSFHENLRAAFLKIASEDKERCRVIDATGDVAAVQSAIKAHIDDLLTRKG